MKSLKLKRGSISQLLVAFWELSPKDSLTLAALVLLPLRFDALPRSHSHRCGHHTAIPVMVHHHCSGGACANTTAHMDSTVLVGLRVDLIAV